MRRCSRKLSVDPRDKVFGILRVLPDSWPKEVYVNVVNSIIRTTKRIDVICESVHYPLYTSSANLPI